MAMVYRYFYVSIHILTLRLLKQFVCFKDRIVHYLFMIHCFLLVSPERSPILGILSLLNGF